MEGLLEKAISQVVAELNNLGFECGEPEIWEYAAGVRAVAAGEQVSCIIASVSPPSEARPRYLEFSAAEILTWCCKLPAYGVIRADVVVTDEPWEVRFHEIDMENPLHLERNLLKRTPANSSWPSK
jgi:hypothetical protein